MINPSDETETIEVLCTVTHGREDTALRSCRKLGGEVSDGLPGLVKSNLGFAGT